MSSLCCFDCFVFFKQKTAYEMRISDWSSDVCSSDLLLVEMPVLDNAVEAAVVAYGPMMLAARHLPLSVRAVRAVTRSEEGRVGKECVSTGRSRWSPFQ